ncbi:MAG TPA: cupin domain-containing protein, partial [Candidatus Methylomirabilis sp.]|nr:cupin domain-containing protein [Candidatus Methylomirabilis sp.]
YLREADRAMAASDPARVVRPAERVESDPTPGMVRERAIDVEGIWAGLVRTAPGMTSGWHHHGDYDTSIYVTRGTLRLESGPGGADIVRAAAGDFVHVPKGAIHREGNDGDEESHLIVVRAGLGPTTINVEGPAPHPRDAGH